MKKSTAHCADAPGTAEGKKKRDMKKNYNVAFMEEDERFVLFLLFLPTSKMLFIVQKKV